MATWGERRKHFIELGIGILVVFLLVGGGYVAFHKAPSCLDNIQNQGEGGVDCNGPCPNACTVDETPLKVDFVRAVSPEKGRVDIIAYVYNPNTNAGAQNAQATIQLFDQTNRPLSQQTIQISVPPVTTVPVFIPNFYTGNRYPGQAFMGIASTSATWPRSGQKVTQPILKNIVIENGATPRVTATLVNPSAVEIDNLTVVVTVFDATKNAVGASQTVIKLLPGSGSVPIVFTWNQPFTKNGISAEILPVPNKN